ncbi:cell envelope biogenesis protein OmpA [Streptomyces sp. NPDC048376]|uniref:cell envelope biogenesis protein OmpA n=1 Tax=Streptomyces sp. NPDC048376 TaxID=3154926 RepID=UPI003421B213
MPWVSLVHGGHAAFGSLDAERALTPFLRRLCQIRGQTLNERCYLIVRPADAVQGCSPSRRCTPSACHTPPRTAPRPTAPRRTTAAARSWPTTQPDARAPTRPARVPPPPPDEGHTARSGSPADRYEAWMIHTQTYRLVHPPDRPDAPAGISVDVPVLRTRLLRPADLAPGQQHLMDL